MVLVIVAVQPVAADGLGILEASHEFTNGSQSVGIAGVVDRIRLGDAEHTTVLDVGAANHPDMLQLSLAELDQLGVRRVPYRITLGAEVLEAKAGLGGIRDHVGAPASEILDAADAHVWGVDVDPV